MGHAGHGEFGAGIDETRHLTQKPRLGSKNDKESVMFVVFSRKHCEGFFRAELLVNLRRVACTESPAWSHQHRVTCAEPSAKSQAHRAKCSERGAKSEVHRVSAQS